MTGERAYQGSPTEAALARLTTPPHIPDWLPQEWRTLLRRMTSLDEHLRPTADEVAQTLRNIAVGADPATATALIRSQAPATRVLSEPVFASNAAAEAGQEVPRWRDARARLSSRPALVTLAVQAVIVFLIGGLLLGQSADRSEGTSDIPSDTPKRLQEPLQDLHDAVKGR